MRTHFHSHNAFDPDHPFAHRFIMLALPQRLGWSEPVEVWLGENVGSQYEAWVTNSLGDIFIKDDASAFAFKLRWC